MGFLKGLLAAAAPAIGNMIAPGIGGQIGSIVGSAIGGSGGGGGSSGGGGSASNLTVTAQDKLDPRADKMLWGENGKGGLLSQYQGYLNQPQSQALQNFGTASGDYLTQYGKQDLGAIRGAAQGLMTGNTAPTFGAHMVGPAAANIGSYASGNMVQAPRQNNLDLTGSYNSLINGAPGANPYLTGAIQKGINQSSNAFGNMVTDAKNATQDVLGSVRGNSVLAGQYGGSRQGIAEGRAIDSMNTNLARAASQFGQNNTDAALAAQAGAYDADRNRQLSATQGLGAQQYGVALQDANTKNAAEFMNVGNAWDNSKFNATLQQQSNLANQNAAQQTFMANQASQLQTNAQNNAAATNGAGLLGSALNYANNAATAQDNYGINRATEVNGLLAPYLSLNGSSTKSQPLYQNNGAGAAGGGLLGLAGALANSNSSPDFAAIRNQDGGGLLGNLTNMFGSKPSSLTNMLSNNSYSVGF